MKNGRMLLLALLSIALSIGITGCSKETPVTVEEETPLCIKVYGSLDEAYLPFFNALAEQFPEVELQYEYQWDNAGIQETERRMIHGDGPDLAVVNGAALLSLTDKNLLLDLTGMEFSLRYHVSTMTELNDSGRVMGLPLPNDLRCLVCNRGILEENGITWLPKTVGELQEICQILSERGQGAIIADEHLYLMLLYTSYLCKPMGYEWLQSYNEGKETMAGTPAADAWEKFAELAAVSGYIQEKSIATPAYRTNLVINGQYAFRSVNLSNLNYMLDMNPELNLVALPLLGETEEDQWVFYAHQRNMRYFVANGVLAQPENAKKQEVILQMLDWISTEEAQQILASCGSSAVSYVSNIKLNQGNVMEYLDPIIDNGHLTSSDSFGRGVDDVITQCALEIVYGKLLPEEAVRICDKQNQEYQPLEEWVGVDEVIGTATDPIYWRKPEAVTVGSPMTQLAAIAMAEAFPEADFAFAMAKNTASTLYKGEITLHDAIVCTNGESDSELMLVQATGAQIKEIVEEGVGAPYKATFTAPYGIAGKGRLLHPSGLTYKADVTREAGGKVTEMALADGSELDLDKTYTIVVSRLMIDGVTEPNLKGCQAEPTGKYLRDVLAEYIRTHKEISPPEMNFEIIGASPIYTLY